MNGQPLNFLGNIEECLVLHFKFHEDFWNRNSVMEFWVLSSIYHSFEEAIGTTVTRNVEIQIKLSIITFLRHFHTTIGHKICYALQLELNVWNVKPITKFLDYWAYCYKKQLVSAKKETYLCISLIVNFFQCWKLYVCT